MHEQASIIYWLASFTRFYQVMPSLPRILAKVGYLLNRFFPMLSLLHLWKMPVYFTITHLSGDFAKSCHPSLKILQKLAILIIFWMRILPFLLGPTNITINPFITRITSTRDFQSSCHPSPLNYKSCPFLTALSQFLQEYIFYFGPDPILEKKPYPDSKYFYYKFQDFW